MNNGKHFESLAELVFCTLSENDAYAKVSRDVKLEGPDCERQVDVLVETSQYGFQTKTLVECRDYSRPLDIEHIDALDSKSTDLIVDMVVLVSRNGFTKNAVKKAKRKNIRLCTLNEGKDLAEIGLDLRLAIVEVVPINIFIEATNNTGQPFSTGFTDLMFNGLPLLEYLKISIETGVLKIRSDSQPIVWHPSVAELTVTNERGQELDGVSLGVVYETNCYVGFLSQLKNTLLFKYLSDAEVKTIYKTEELRGYRENFSLLANEETFTLKEGQRMRIHALVPDLEFVNFGAGVSNQDGSSEKYGNSSAMFDINPNAD